MKAIEEKALYEIKRLANEADQKTTSLAVKLTQSKEVKNQDDVYPIGSDCREIIRWIDAILSNKP